MPSPLVPSKAPRPLVPPKMILNVPVRSCVYFPPWANSSSEENFLRTTFVSRYQTQHLGGVEEGREAGRSGSCILVNNLGPGHCPRSCSSAQHAGGRCEQRGREASRREGLQGVGAWRPTRRRGGSHAQVGGVLCGRALGCQPGSCSGQGHFTRVHRLGCKLRSSSNVASKAMEKQNKLRGSSKSGHTRHRPSAVVQLRPLPIRPFRADVTPAVRPPPHFLVSPSRRRKR